MNFLILNNLESVAVQRNIREIQSVEWEGDREKKCVSESFYMHVTIPILTMFFFFKYRIFVFVL